MRKQYIVISKKETGEELFFTSVKTLCLNYDWPYDYIIRQKMPFVFKGTIVNRKQLINN